MRFAYTGLKRTVSIMKAVDLYVVPYFPYSVYRILLMVSFHITLGFHPIELCELKVK